MEKNSASASAQEVNSEFVSDENGSDNVMDAEVEIEVMQGSDKMDLLWNHTRSTRRMPSKLQFDHNVAMGRFTAVNPAQFHQDTGLSHSIHGADDVRIDAGSAVGQEDRGSFVVGNANFAGAAQITASPLGAAAHGKIDSSVWVSHNRVSGGGFCGRCLRSCRQAFEPNPRLAPVARAAAPRHLRRRSGLGNGRDRGAA